MKQILNLDTLRESLNDSPLKHKQFFLELLKISLQLLDFDEPSIKILLDRLSRRMKARTTISDFLTMLRKSRIIPDIVREEIIKTVKYLIIELEITNKKVSGGLF